MMDRPTGIWITCANACASRESGLGSRAHVLVVMDGYWFLKTYGMRDGHSGSALLESILFCPGPGPGFHQENQNVAALNDPFWPQGPLPS